MLVIRKLIIKFKVQISKFKVKKFKVYLISAMLFAQRSRFLTLNSLPSAIIRSMNRSTVSSRI